MPQVPSVQQQEMADLAWCQAVISVVDTALRTVDEPDQKLVTAAEILASYAVEGRRGGARERQAYRLALIKVLHMAVGALYGTSPGDRDLAAVAQEESEQVRIVLDAAVTGYAQGLEELIRTLTYPPSDRDLVPTWGLVRAAIHAVRMALKPLGDDIARWEAAAEIMAKTGR